MASRREDHGTDKQCQWKWVQLSGKRGKFILIVTTYRFNQTYPSEAGYSTAYMEQYRVLLKANVSNLNPKKRILTDLAAFITTWRGINTHSSIVVIMDVNGNATDPQFKVFIADTALHDVVAHHSPESYKQST